MLVAGLALSIFLEYINPGIYVPVIQAAKIGTIIPLLVFSLSLLQNEPVSNGQMFRHPNTRWILFLMLLLTISLFISDVTLYSYKIFKSVLTNVFWFMMVVKIVTDRDKLHKVAAALVWAHIIVLVLNPQVILEPHIRSYLRGGWFLGDGNDFALSVCVIWPLCLLLVQNAKTKMTKFVYIGALAVLILAIVGTQSRGASLALAGSLAFLWWHSRRKFVNIMIIGVVAIGAASFVAPQYFDRMQSIANYQEDGSAMGRIIAWKSSLRMVREYPLTGVGAGHFPIALGTQFRPPEWGERNLPWLTAHSMYFLVLGELGLPGFACFLTLLIGNYLRLNRLIISSRGSPDEEAQSFSNVFLLLSTSLVGFCIGGAFLSVTYYPHIFILSGLVVAATLAYDRTVAALQRSRNVLINENVKPGVPLKSR